jgi:hypothetical protein
LTYPERIPTSAHLGKIRAEGGEADPSRPTSTRELSAPGWRDRRRMIALGYCSPRHQGVAFRNPQKPQNSPCVCRGLPQERLFSLPAGGRASLPGSLPERRVGCTIRAASL